MYTTTQYLKPFWTVLCASLALQSCGLNLALAPHHMTKSDNSVKENDAEENRKAALSDDEETIVGSDVEEPEGEEEAPATMPPGERGEGEEEVKKQATAPGRGSSVEAPSKTFGVKRKREAPSSPSEKKTKSELQQED